MTRSAFATFAAGNTENSFWQDMLNGHMEGLGLGVELGEEDSVGKVEWVFLEQELLVWAE